MKGSPKRSQRDSAYPSPGPGSGIEQSQTGPAPRLSEQELRRRLRDLATLTAVSMALNSTLDPEEVLRIIVAAVIQVIGCQKSAVFELDLTGTALSLRMEHGLSDDFVQAAQSLPLGSLRTQVVVTGEVIAVGDVTTDPVFFEVADLAEAEGFRAFVDLPLIVEGQVVGSLAVYFAESRTFSDFELELLTIFANQAAFAIHNARLYDRLERRVRELSVLAQIEEATMASLHVERLLAGLAEGLCRVLDAAGGIILLWESQQERGARGATVGLSHQVLRLLQDEPDELLLVAETVARREPVIVEEIVTSRLVGQRLATQVGFGSLVGLPLMTGGKVVGVMILGEPRWTDQEALDRAMLAARQVALAIANALLFEETSRQARDLMALSRAARAVASLGGLDAVLGRLLGELGRIVPSDGSAIYLNIAESDAPVLVVSRGLRPVEGAGVRGATLKRLLERVTRQKQPLLLPGHQGSGAVFPELADQIPGSLLYVPILYENRCLGMIAVGHQQEGAFGQREQSLVASFADHAAVAIENARRYETVLQERNLIQTIVAAMADGVIVTDTLDQVVMANQAAKEMVDAEIGQRWSVCSSSSELAQRASALMATRGPELTNGQQQATLERDGRLLNVGTAHLPDGNGETAGAVHVIRDITHWIELDQMKSDFISQVSHELRTPLTTIKTLVGLLRKGGQGGEKVREYLDIIESEVNRQALLVDDLLRMGRLEGGEMDWTVVEVSLTDVAAQAMRVCLPLATEKGITLTGQPLPALPRVMGTPRRLQQVLVNLLVNAVKYTPPGGQVAVAAGSDESSVWIAVRDTGPGIPKAALSHVFDKFYQVRQHGRDHEGVGLGLAIARQIVEALKGTIRVESEVGSGSCFTVRLPRARAFVAALREDLKGAEDECANSLDR